MPKKGTTLAKSARFLCFVSQTIAFETGGDKSGGYTNDPKDAGGETKWGISKRAHPELNIKALTYTQAVEVYENEYWLDIYDYIKDDTLAFKLFDMGILTGKVTATKLLQQAIVDCGILVKKDGVFGSMTLTAVNTVNPAMLYNRYLFLQEKRFNRIVFLKPWNKRFIKGWLVRLGWKWDNKDEEC